MSVNEKMTQLADAIRAQAGITSKLTLDGMINTVSQIGGSAPVKRYCFTTNTFETYTPSFTMQHDLGVVPTFACYFVFPLGLEEGEDWSKPNGMCWCAGYVYNKNIYLIKGQDGSVMSTTGTTVCSSVSETEVTFSPYLNFKGGYTYAFIVWE